MQLLQSRALPLGYPAHRLAKINSLCSSACRRKSLVYFPLPNPSSRRRFQSSPGLNIPAGVMMPVINSAGVTSNPALNAPLVGLATRTYSRRPRDVTPHAPRTSPRGALQSECRNRAFKFQSMVDKRNRHVKWNAVPFRQHRLGVSADFVRHFAGAAQGPVAAHNHQVNFPRCMRWPAALSAMIWCEIFCCASSHAVSVAPCERGRVSSQ
jgi:hypothetical protein